MLPVLNTRHDFSFRRALAPHLVGDDHARDVPQTLQQLTEEARGGFLIPVTLDQNIENIALLVDSTPKIVILAIDLDEHFVEVPLVSATGTPPAKTVSKGLAELERPLANRFIGKLHAAHRHDFFDIAKTQSEAEGEPHSVADDL